VRVEVVLEARRPGAGTMTSFQPHEFEQAQTYAGRNGHLFLRVTERTDRGELLRTQRSVYTANRPPKIQDILAELKSKGDLPLVVRN
jgi:hypothetical protein